MKKYTITIYFCTRCGWLMRATWLAQEFITTFKENLNSVNLIPDDGGRFEIQCDKKIIFSRKDEGGFIDVKLMKQRIRDIVDPERSLGHSDRKSGN